MVVSNILYFHPYLGKIPILTNIFQIFQMGWNHQLGKHGKTVMKLNERYEMESREPIVLLFWFMFFFLGGGAVWGVANVNLEILSDSARELA